MDASNQKAAQSAVRRSVLPLSMGGEWSVTGRAEPLVTVAFQMLVAKLVQQDGAAEAAERGCAVFASGSPDPRRSAIPRG